MCNVGNIILNSVLTFASVWICNVGNIILNSVLTFASVWIVRKFLDTFYEKKRWNVLSVSVWSIYIIFQGYVQFHSGDASTLTTIVNVLLCIMISAISYYGFGKIIYFYLRFFWAVWALVEMIIFFFLNLFCLEQRDFNFFLFKFILSRTKRF
ncbi:hypothetical protein DWX81_05605 [Roseburia inulinivorans]|nr:hypothetical protein DWX81_05605 [Roseburia inulinivorans]